jgi:hypothetical protein
MIEENWDTRRNAAQIASEAPSQREAHETDYGFCAYGDAPPAIGGGTPWFYWFETKQTMLQFLGEHALFLHPPGGLNLATADGAIRRAVTEFGTGDLEALRVQLNRHLKGSSQFSWLGSFKQLRESDHPEAEKIRGEFPAENRTPGETRPVDKNDARAFAEFLVGYGV